MIARGIEKRKPKARAILTLSGIIVIV